jgi:hypothetical protein
MRFAALGIPGVVDDDTQEPVWETVEYAELQNGAHVTNNCDVSNRYE